MAFDLNNYEPVAVRLHRILGQIRDAGQTPSVRTELLSAPGADICVMRAELWVDGTLVATGHAEEIRGQGNVNRTSHLENAETSSVGRCVENYSPTPDLNKRPSQEEMQKVQRYEGAQQSTSAGASQPNVTVRGPMQGGATEKQIGYVKGACKRAGVVPPPWIDQLSKADASAFIEAEKNGEAVQTILDRMSEEEPF